MDRLNDKLISDLMIAYAPLWNIKMLDGKRKRRKWARKLRKLRRRVNRNLYKSMYSYQVILLKKYLGFEGRCEIKKGDIIC